MATKILEYIWDGGSGFADKVVLIGYCKEEPKEVLRLLLKTHCINAYIESYCSPINEYPANCSGLVIREYDPQNQKEYGLDIAVTRTIEDYTDSLEKFKWNKFNIDSFKRTIDYIGEKVEDFSDKNIYKKIYSEIHEDFKQLLDEISDN